MRSLSLLAALVALVTGLAGCELLSGQASGKTDGVFPFEVSGLAFNVRSCEAFDLGIGDPVTLAFTGRRFGATADIFRNCDVRLVGDGSVELNGIPSSIFTFRVDLNDDCNHVGDNVFVNFSGVVLHTNPDASVDCIAVNLGGLPGLTCVLDQTCVFDLPAPRVQVFFDVNRAIDRVVDDALDNLLPFREGEKG